MFRQPIAGQLIILRRRLLRLQRQAAQASESERLALASQLVIDTLDVVESLIVDPKDAEFLEEALLMGKVDHQDVMAVLGRKFEEEKKATKKAIKAPAKASPRARAKR